MTRRSVPRTARTALVVCTVLLVGGLASACGVSEEESADTYPSRPVEVIVPFPAGGGGDAIARGLVDAVNASGSLDEDVQVVNRDGGGGVVGTAEVLGAEPDGYTLEFAAEGPITLQPAIGEVPYEPLDMTPIAQVSRGSVVIAVPGDSPFRTIDDLLRAAKRQPGRIGMGEGPAAYAVAAAQLEKKAGVRFKRVDFEGDAASTTALLGGNVDATMTQPAAILGQVKSGDIRALAVTGSERIPFLPEVPTLVESGVDVVSLGVYGVFGPAGIPGDVARKLSDAFADAMASDEFASVAESVGVTINPADGDTLISYYRERTDEVNRLVDEGGLQ